MYCYFVPSRSDIYISVFVYISLVCLRCNAEKELRLLGLVPMTGRAWPGGLACLVPIQMAIDGINAHEDLLQGYNLTFEYIDTECIPGKAVYKMEKQLYERPPYVMIIGPVLSITALATGEVSYNWNITQFAFAASSPNLSDRERFPRFYRYSAPDRNSNGARIGLMKKFNWRRIATIHHATEFFSTVMGDFIDDAQSNKMMIVSQQVFLEDPTSQVNNLKNIDARIIMTAMYEDRARDVLCAAYKIGLYGPKIVWLFMGYYSSYFWTMENEKVDCTVAEMSLAAEGVFLVKAADQNAKAGRGIANITYSEFIAQLLEHPNYKMEFQKYNNMADNCFDTTWMTALALNCTIEKLQQLGHHKTLDDSTYADTDIHDVIFECLGGSTMLGLTRRVFFPVGKDPVYSVRIERVQNGRRLDIGYHWKDTVPSYFEWLDDKLHWKDGKIPRDSTIVMKVEVVIPMSMYIVMCTCAGIGISLAVSLLVFNVAFGENRFVKMSSPNINNVLLLGCIMCYSTVFIKTIEVSTHVLCEVRVICFCLGFTMTFGALFSKTWRVYRIFTNKKLLRRSIKDIQLLAIIGVMVATVLAVLVIRGLVGSHEVIVRILKKEIYTIGNDMEIHPFVRVCHASHASYFGWVIYILEGTLLAFGAFLAWETRKVTIAALNDSREIGLCLYNVVILSAVGLTLSLLLDEQEVLLYGVTSGCLIIGTTVTQLVVFIPKIHAVHKKVDIYDNSSTNARASQPTQTESVKQAD